MKSGMGAAGGRRGEADGDGCGVMENGLRARMNEPECKGGSMRVVFVLVIALSLTGCGVWAQDPDEVRRYSGLIRLPEPPVEPRYGAGFSCSDSSIRG